MLKAGERSQFDATRRIGQFSSIMFAKLFAEVILPRGRCLQSIMQTRKFTLLHFVTTSNDFYFVN